jgi:hypothetical protein
MGTRNDIWQSRAQESRRNTYMEQRLFYFIISIYSKRICFSRLSLSLSLSLYLSLSFLFLIRVIYYHLHYHVRIQDMDWKTCRYQLLHQSGSCTTCDAMMGTCPGIEDKATRIVNAKVKRRMGETKKALPLVAGHRTHTSFCISPAASGT